MKFFATLFVIGIILALIGVMGLIVIPSVILCFGLMAGIVLAVLVFILVVLLICCLF